MSGERCSLISWLVVTVRCSEGPSSLTALHCPHTRRQETGTTLHSDTELSGSHIPTFLHSTTGLTLAWQTEKGWERSQITRNERGETGILHRLPFKRESLIKCSSEDLHKQRGSGRILVELYNHYYRHGGRGGGREGWCGGGGHFNIHHDTELQSKQSGQPHWRERLPQPTLSPDHDASWWFWTGVMYHGLIFRHAESRSE